MHSPPRTGGRVSVRISQGEASTPSRTLWTWRLLFAERNQDVNKLLISTFLYKLRKIIHLGLTLCGQLPWETAKDRGGTWASPRWAFGGGTEKTLWNKTGKKAAPISNKLELSSAETLSPSCTVDHRLLICSKKKLIKLWSISQLKSQSTFWSTLSILESTGKKDITLVN